MKRLFTAAVLCMVLASCGSDSVEPATNDADATGAIEIPADATYCSTFTELTEEVAKAIPFGDPQWQDSANEQSRLAAIMAELAPADIAEAAQDNADYFEALAAANSATSFVEGNIATWSYSFANC